MPQILDFIAQQITLDHLLSGKTLVHEAKVKGQLCIGGDTTRSVAWSTYLDCNTSLRFSTTSISSLINLALLIILKLTQPLNQNSDLKFSIPRSIRYFKLLYVFLRYQVICLQYISTLEMQLILRKNLVSIQLY